MNVICSGLFNENGSWCLVRVSSEVLRLYVSNTRYTTVDLVVDHYDITAWLEWFERGILVERGRDYNIVLPMSDFVALLEDMTIDKFWYWCLSKPTVQALFRTEVDAMHIDNIDL